MVQNKYNEAIPQPLNKGFGVHTSAGEITRGVNLCGKLAIVSGGYAGVGLETTRMLSLAGATVIVPARDVAAAQKNLGDIENTELEQMDLTDVASINAFAEKFLASDRSLHLLINNTGVMQVPTRKHCGGFESQLAINHLGHFQLTAKLWPALKKANGARVVNVSSFGQQVCPNLEELASGNQRGEKYQRDGQANAAANLFAVELDVNGQDFGVCSYALQAAPLNGTDLYQHKHD